MFDDYHKRRWTRIECCSRLKKKKVQKEGLHQELKECARESQTKQEESWKWVKQNDDKEGHEKKCNQSETTETTGQSGLYC